ncbi:choline dehydrogenase, putative [Trypanosoma cruzi]|uniref:Choline dehydrogenase n=1 Tax=Trypanosoma cruzi Dm28c TaxID=1416333 RepID=V5DIB3_TRYCR|nr:choline dehydrogenase, putative [Trypanosoma cruzi]ESS67136.1 choline dehydrogenase [Trypanosoma cruzi Dm28c]KAF8304450.1 putative choline dehydrogenase [Trypanosoma cruzi]PBJ75160.1 choline dehydrogenase [Trypanosoma cruzi cruzi]RNF18770.1 putative choline dehydrogenase [Trypanosoma cruzi]
MYRTLTLRRANYNVAVVGGGLAGCLVAGRLAMENLSTIVLEEGDDIRKKPRWYRSIPCSLLIHRFARRNYESCENFTTPQRTHRAEDPLAPVMIPTPRVLGGGGIMGGRSWNLGDQNDWDGAGWSFREELLPRVQRLENLEDPPPHRGKRGKFFISRSQALSPFFKVFCEAMSKDTALTSAFNGKEYHVRPGCGRAESFVDQRSGIAHTTLQSYLIDAIALKRPLEVVCNARVIGINAIDNNKVTASGVTYVRPNGETEHVGADAVILCAGGIGTPRLLACSQGTLSIDPAVGTNFWDKPQVKMQFRTRIPLSHNCFMEPIVQMCIGINLRYGNPLHALCSAYDDMICYWSSSGEQTPDVKFIFQPFTMNNDGSTPKGVEHGVQIIAQLVRPKSRGCIRADGTIDPKYLTHPDDEKALCKAVARIKELTKMLPFSNIFTDMIAERFESASIYGGASFPVFDQATFRVKNTDNVYVCDESVFCSPLIGDSLPYMLALGEKFSDGFLRKPDMRSKSEAAMKGMNKARIIY